MFLIQLQINPHKDFKIKRLKKNASTVNVIFVKHSDFKKAAFSGG